MSQTTAEQIGAAANKRALAGAKASIESNTGICAKGEKSDSLAAFMRAIKFHVPRRANGNVDRTFAQPHPRARASLDADNLATIDESSCIPSAN